MITKELLKTEIDKVQNEYLELLYKVIKAFEPSLKTEYLDKTIPKGITKSNMELSWHEFIKATYGCLSNAPIERADQGKYEIREVIG